MIYCLLLRHIEYKGKSFQVPVLSILFASVFLGNTLTTMMIIPQKLKERVKLKQRFAALDKYLRRTNREESDTNLAGRQNKSSSTFQNGEGENKAKVQ